MLLAGALPAAPAPAQGPAPSAATSPRGRFVIAGVPPSQSVGLATWAEEVADRVAQDMGSPLPLSPRRPLRISAQRDPNQAHGRVIRAQGLLDGVPQQKLILLNQEDLEQEDILEGLCGLLANRYVIRYQSAAQREEDLGVAPAWLAVGLAQHLYPELRARNTRVMLERWRSGEAPSFHEVLQWEYLPDGRWSQKSACGLAFEWLRSLPEADALLDRLVRQRAETGMLDPEWMQRNVFRVASERDVEKTWDLWLAGRTQVRREWGTVSAEDTAALRRNLRIRPRQLGMVLPPDAPGVLTPADLMAYRGEPWLERLATELAARLRHLALGRSEEFQRVVEDYVRYLDTLPAGSAPRGVRTRPGAQAAADPGELLHAADLHLGHLETQLAARDGYLREVQDMTPAALERKAWLDRVVERVPDTDVPAREQYLDAMEERQFPGR